MRAGAMLGDGGQLVERGAFAVRRRKNYRYIVQGAGIHVSNRLPTVNVPCEINFGVLTGYCARIDRRQTSECDGELRTRLSTPVAN